MESKLYRAKPLRHGSDGLNRCRSLECAGTGQLRSILHRIPHSIPPPLSVYESVCVWVDKKYLCLFSFPASVFAGVREIPLLHRCCSNRRWPCLEFSTFWGLQTEWLRKHSLFVTGPDYGSYMAKLHHITNGSGEADPEKWYLWLSLLWSIQAHSVPFPLRFTMTTSPVAESFVFSW